MALAMEAVANKEECACLFFCSEGLANAHCVEDAAAYCNAMMMANAATVRMCRRGGSSLLIVLTWWPILMIVSVVFQSAVSSVKGFSSTAWSALFQRDGRLGCRCLYMQKKMNSQQPRPSFSSPRSQIESLEPPLLTV
jgi:hypothetical protein